MRYPGGMPSLLQFAYAVRRRLLALLRIRTRGVKMIATDAAGRVLLVRNSYGRTEQWVLPGGGIGRREAPSHAAMRELEEETGCRTANCSALNVYRSTGEGKRDTIHVFVCTTADDPVADRHEVREAAFFPADALPQDASPATRRRIGEWRGRAPLTADW